MDENTEEPEVTPGSNDDPGTTPGETTTEDPGTGDSGNDTSGDNNSGNDNDNNENASDDSSEENGGNDMAYTNIDEAKVKTGFNKVDPASLTSISNGIEYTVKNSDERTILVVQNAGEASATLTLKAPVKGTYAGSNADEEFTIGAGKVAIIVVESAVYAEADSQKVSIAISNGATIYAGVFEF